MSVSAVLFDLDETLFNRSESMRAFVESQFIHMELGNFENLRALSNRFLELDDRGRVSKREVYAKLLAEIGRVDAVTSTRLFDDYETNAWRFARAFHGTYELLSWLKKQKLPIAIVSNGETHVQLRSLHALKLDLLVDECVISEREECRKPEPAIFQCAAERLNVQVEDCIFVGDSPEADMFGARSLGMKTIWFPNGAVWPDSYNWRPEATIGLLSEVRELVQLWARW